MKVIDFGLAKRMQRLQDGPADEAYTKPGTMVGTVDICPEQARGEEVGCPHRPLGARHCVR